MSNENIKSNGSTYIHGIGSSQAIDTAGEIVDLAGLDCSSLVGGAFNWEHSQSNVPASVVGKVLEYKKIFSEKDCEKDEHKYFWDKCKTPYLYVMGRLFDDKKPSAIEAAALFIDDAEHPDEPPSIGFSIEGSKVSKSGIIVDKSIARRVTCTGTPANKTCIAEMIKNPDLKQDSDTDSIFKSEPSHTIELLQKTEELEKASKNRFQYDKGQKSTNLGTTKQKGTFEQKGVHMPPLATSGGGESVMGSHVRNPSNAGSGSKEMARRHAQSNLKEIKQMPKPNLGKAEVPGSKYPSAAQVKPSTKPASTGIKFGPIDSKPKNMGQEIGKTKSGKPVMSHAKPQDYRGFGPQEHQEAANLHMAHAEKGKGIPGATHFDTAKRHMALAGRGERQGAKTQATRQQAVKKPDINVGRMGKSELKKDGNMAASPPEPNPANAAAMQAGATSGGTSLSEAFSNIKSGLGFGKKEQPKKSLKKGVSVSLGMGSRGMGLVRPESTDTKNKRGLFNPDVDKISGRGTMVGGVGMSRSEKKGNLKKAMSAGSGMAAPGNLSGGASLTKESLDKKMKKSQWLTRAEQEYKMWSKREQFENFMAKHMPSLTKGEITAIGQTLALRKSLKAEKNLAKIVDEGQDSWVKKKEK